MLRLLEAGVQSPNGLIARNAFVRARCWNTVDGQLNGFRLGEIVEFDFAQGIDAITNSKEGSLEGPFVNARSPTVSGVRYGRVHGVVLEAVAQGFTTFVQILGVVDRIVSATADVDPGSAMTIGAVGDGGNQDAKRIKGLFLENKTGSGRNYYRVLFDGIMGFGQNVVSHVPSGISSGKPSGHSSGNPSGGVSTPSGPSSGTTSGLSGDASGVSSGSDPPGGGPVDSGTVDIDGEAETNIVVGSIGQGPPIP